MPSNTCDLLVIGGGSAGFNAACVAHGLGKRVAIVDGARELGGLCILRGCMPSKTLLHAADVLHRARHGRKFGIRAADATIDMKALQRWKKKVIGEFADYRLQALQSGRFALHRSHARFLDPHTLALDSGGRLCAGKILIGTGSRVSMPPIPGLAGTPHWTSDDVLDLDYVPQSVIVLGGGIVACELAQFLNRIGSAVTLIQRSPRLLREHSPEGAEVVAQAFCDEGIRLHTGTRILSVSASGNGRKREQEITVVFEQTEKDGVVRKVTRRARYLFNALGREPAIDKLNLSAAGVALDERRRIRVNRWQQTTQPHIYAAGDVCGPHEIVHLAVAQGELAARHAFGARLHDGKPLKPIDESLFLGVVFTDPALATIGWREHQLRERGQPFAVASYPFNDHGKSIVMDALCGYVKVLADPANGRVLGAEIVGRDAGELIHAFSGPLAMRATVHDMLRAPWYHPTLAEIITYPLEELAGQIQNSSGRAG